MYRCGLLGENFESGTISYPPWQTISSTFGSVVITDEWSKVGTYSVKCEGYGLLSSAHLRASFSPSLMDVWIKSDIKFNNLPIFGLDERIHVAGLQCVDNHHTGLSCVVDTTGEEDGIRWMLFCLDHKLVYPYRVYSTIDIVVEVDTEYCLATHWVKDQTEGKFEAYLDGAFIGGLYDMDTTGNGDVDRINFGYITSTGFSPVEFTLSMDNICIDDVRQPTCVYTTNPRIIYELT